MNEHSMTAAAAPDFTAPVTVASDEPAAELFAINLCASMTPMPSVPKHLKGFERYKLYQVSKLEDGRRRYRLRLGFFTCEADAEMIVGSIRSLYPAAFTSCLSKEDLRYTDGFAPGSKSSSVKPAAIAAAAPVAAPAPIESVRSAEVQTPANGAIQVRDAAALKSSAIATAQTRPAIESPTTSAAALTQSASIGRPAAAPVSRPEAAKPAVEAEHNLEIDLRGTAGSAALPTGPAPKAEVVPFHVAKGIQLPDVTLELEPETSAPPTISATAPVVQRKPEGVRASLPAAPKHSAPATAKSVSTSTPATVREPLPPPPQIIEDYIPVLDTTLTLRTLTQAEIDDPNQPKWFVVELALSDHPVNLDAMPKLDIFSAYSLYSVAITTGGTIRHALRLGFFREEVSAEAVSGYLKTFFASPTITRVSAAEYTRFAESPRKVEAAKTENGADKVVQLNRASVPKQTPVAAKSLPQAAKPSPATIAGAPARTIRPANAAKPAVKNRPSSRSLNHQLQEEARQTLLSESGIRKEPKAQSFLSRLIGRSLD